MELMSMSWKFEVGSWKLDEKRFAPGEVDTSTESKGFTLIELLVVISIIAVLAVIGIVVFTGVQKAARDSKRRSDVEAIAKAYEVKYQAAGGKYQSLADSDFASGGIPVPPEGGDYFRVTDSEGSGFKVCAALESNSTDVCNTPSPNCFCKSSSQGTIPLGATNLVGTNSEIGLGGSSYSACDTNGTLAIGLVGYWKMDEGTGTGIADSSGNGGTLQFKPKPPTWVTNGKSGNALKMYEGSDRKYSGASGNSSALNVSGTQLSFGTWFYLTDTPPQYAGLIQKYSGEGGYRIYIRSDMRPEVQIKGNGISGDPVSQDGKWHFVMATYDGNKIKLYVDDKAPKPFDFTQSIGGVSTTPLSIGSEESAAIYGYVDEARVYNRALSQAEVSALAGGCLSPS